MSGNEKANSRCLRSVFLRNLAIGNALSINVVVTLILGVFALRPTLATAESAARYPHTFRGALQTALVNRHEVLIDQRGVEGATAGIAEARGAYSPSLKVFSDVRKIRAFDDFSGLDATAVVGGNTIPITVTRETPPYQINTGIELSYNVYAGGAHGARLAEAHSLHRAAEAQLDVTKKAVILNVTKAYWELRKSEIAYIQATRNLKFGQAESAVADEQWRQRRIAHVELTAKKLTLAQREAALRSALRTMEDARRRYIYSLGLPVDSETIKNFPLLHDEASGVDLEKLLSEFEVEKAAEITKAKADVDNSKAKITELRAAYKPTVEFYYQYTGIGRGRNSYSEAETNYGKETTVVGLRLNWSWFDGFQTSHRVEQAAIASEQMKIKAEQTERQMQILWQEKMSQEAELSDQVVIAQIQVALRSAQVTVAETRLQLQQSSTLQYQTAELALEQARADLAALEIDLLIAKIENQLAQVQ